MTPHELNLFASVYGDEMKSEQEERLTLAYMTAYWQRVEKLEPLSEILGREQEPEQKNMSDMDMLLKVQQLNAAMGGSVE